MFVGMKRGLKAHLEHLNRKYRIEKKERNSLWDRFVSEDEDKVHTWFPREDVDTVFK